MPRDTPSAPEVMMTRIALLALLLTAAVGGPGERTVWDDEDEAREAALDAAEIAEADDAAAESGDD